MKQIFEHTIHELLIRQYELSFDESRAEFDKTMQFYQTSIKINFVDQEKKIELFTHPTFLETMSELMLCEDNPNDETLIDLAKEITNLIVGSAKIYAQEYDMHFNIELPNFMGKSSFLPQENKENILYYTNHQLWLALIV